MSLAAADSLPPPFFLPCISASAPLAALIYRLPPSFYLPVASAASFHVRRQCLAVRRVCHLAVRRFPVPARQNTVSEPSCRHRAGRFLAPSAAFPACTSAVSFSRRPQDGKYKYLFRRNSPSGRHGLAGNLLFLHRFERLRRAGQHRFRAEGTRDRIQLKTFR